jgi:large subunit ribosomal protein L30
MREGASERVYRAEEAIASGAIKRRKREMAAKKTTASATMLRITLKSGLVAKPQTQRRVVTALGLRKFGSSVVLPDTPTIRGMINKIPHLLCVCPAETSAPVCARARKASKAADSPTKKEDAVIATKTRKAPAKMVGSDEEKS